MATQQTYIMLKPDTIKRRLIGQIITRIEQKGYRIIEAKQMTLNKTIIAEHYSHLTDKPFFPKLEAYMLSGPVFGMIVERDDVIQGMRTMMGPTDFTKALPGTIRGDFANSTTYNLIHGSDSEETAKTEIARFFGK